MSARVRSGGFTFGDFLELVQEDRKADLLDGEIYMASPENLEHNELLEWMVRLLGLFVEQRRLGRVTVNRVAYRLGDRNAPEPDIAFVAADRAHILKHGYVEGAPDLAIEFVSPSSVEHDYELKRQKYEAAGVREYWIIDADDRRALFLVNGPNGFAEAMLTDHAFRSQVLPGFELNPAWLWRRPLPDTLPLVQAMLARG